MKEQSEKEVLIELMEEEHEYFVELLRFMYSKQIKTTDAFGLLQILLLSDRFMVSNATHAAVTAFSKLSWNIPVRIHILFHSFLTDLCVLCFFFVLVV